MPTDIKSYEVKYGGVGSPNAYSPYKMSGHELPGPNQKSPNTLRSFGTNDTEFLNQESTDAGISPTNYGSAVGSSPNKLGAAVAEPVVDSAVAGGGDPFNSAARAAGTVVEPAVGSAVDAVSAAPVAEVPPHGDESHTGGAVGGEPEEAPWEAMNRKDYFNMDKGKRKEYMGGLDKGQRAQQHRKMIGGTISTMMGGGGFGGMFSDIRLKENIDRVGVSKSGIPVYEFNYIGDNNRYSGAMAQDLLNTEHVTMHESGFYMVNYNNIDVDMKLV